MIGRWLAAAVLGCVLTTPPALADEVKRVEGDEARKLAQTFTEASNKLDNLPVKVTPDLDKSMGLGAKQRALFVVPDSGLKPDALKKVDREVVPLGLLYTHRITLVVAEQSVPAEQHRTVEVSIKDQKAKFMVMQLAVTKVAGRLVLLVFTDGKAPALVTTLVETEDAKDHPLDLQAGKGKDNQAAVILTVLGRFRAAFHVSGQD
jgi:hypothetical protein